MAIIYNQPPEFDIDTNNDGPWKNLISPASNMASFWVAMLNFRDAVGLK